MSHVLITKNQFRQFLGGNHQGTPQDPQSPAGNNFIETAGHFPFWVQLSEALAAPPSGSSPRARYTKAKAKAYYLDQTNEDPDPSDSSGVDFRLPILRLSENDNLWIVNRDTSLSFSSGDNIQVMENAYGELVPYVSGQSGGSEIIKFRAVSASPAIGRGTTGCNYIIGVVTYTGCNVSGVEVDDEVVIFDPEYCYFNLPIDLLVGLRGTAEKFTNPVTEYDLESLVDCEYDVANQGTCVWMVTSTCCAEEYSF